MEGAAQISRGSDSRLSWVDTAKGLCIILVVMMHATLGVGEAMGGEGFLHGIVAFARPFRMPDFFLVSGLFLSRVIDRDWWTYGDKRVVHFVYFYVLWVLIQSIFKLGQVSGGSAEGFVAHLVWALVEPYSTLWFVYLLAVFSIVTKLLRGVPAWLLLGAAACLEIAPIHTGSTLVDEFCDRYVYFLAGYLFAPKIFGLADGVAAKPRKALTLLIFWAALNGVFALTPSDIAGYPTLASLPIASLALGTLGAVAIVSLSALLDRTHLAPPFRYAGRHSIAIYLAFFLPMAATRTMLVKLGIIADVGLVSAFVTTAAILVPLALERLVRSTPLAFLFERPAVFRLAAHPPRLQPAE
jgi:uncharacterized membrane protein YcfT